MLLLTVFSFLCVSGNLQMIVSVRGCQVWHEELIRVEPFFPIFSCDTFCVPQQMVAAAPPDSPRLTPRLFPPRITEATASEHKREIRLLLFFGRLHFLVIHSRSSVVTRYIFSLQPSDKTRDEVIPLWQCCVSCSGDFLFGLPERFIGSVSSVPLWSFPVKKAAN